MGYALFSQTYLEAKKYAPRLNKVYRWIYPIVLINFIIGYFYNIRLGNSALLVSGLFVIIIPFVMVPLVDQKLVNVALVVDELPRVVSPEMFREPLAIKPFSVVVPVTEREPPTTASPVEVRDARVRALKFVLPETERELKLPPDLTVREPLTVALLATER